MSKLRQKISDAVNALGFEFIRKNNLRISVNGKVFDGALSFKRFQLTFIERLAVDEMMAEGAGDNYVSGTIALKESRWKRGSLMSVLAVLIPGRVLSRTAAVVRPGRIKSLYAKLRRYALRFVYFSILSCKRIDYGSVKRVFLVDAGEIKRTRLLGKNYVYHKYLEGKIDLDSRDFDKGDLILFYGDFENIGLRLAFDRRVALLGQYWRQYETAIPVAAVCKNFYRYFSSRGDDLNVKHVKKGQDLFHEVLLSDLTMVSSFENFLTRITGDIEICADSFDSTLFTLSQFTLRNYGHTLTAFQKVLGPYIFSFNIAGNEGLLMEPSRIFTWGRFHSGNLRALGYSGKVEESYSYKLQVYGEAMKRMDRCAIRRQLGIPVERKVVMFSAVGEILGYPLIEDARFAHMLEQLSEICRRRQVFILFKPWPGEDMKRLREFIKYAGFGDFMVADGRVSRKMHNAELLAASDIMVSTLSSFIGEAFYLGVLPVFINYHTSRRYFSSEYSEEFEKFTLAVDERRDFAAVLEKALALDEAGRAAFFEGGRENFEYIFGKVPEA